MILFLIELNVCFDERSVMCECCDGFECAYVTNRLKMSVFRVLTAVFRDSTSMPGASDADGIAWRLINRWKATARSPGTGMMGSGGSPDKYTATRSLRRPVQPAERQDAENIAAAVGRHTLVARGAIGAYR